MSILRDLQNIKVLNSSSLSTIVSLSNDNFRKISGSLYTFLTNIAYNETENSMALNTIELNILKLNRRIELIINSDEMFSVDENGRVRSKSFIADSVAEAKRFRLSRFDGFPISGHPGEMVYGKQDAGGILDFWGYVQGQGWLSLTGSGSSSAGSERWMGAVMDIVSSPPIPTNYARYLIDWNTAATGDFAGHEGEIVMWDYDKLEWEFLDTVPGMALTNESNNYLVYAAQDTSPISWLTGDPGGMIGPDENHDITEYTGGLYTDFTETTEIGTPIDRYNKLFLSLVPPSAPDLTDWSGSKAGTLANGNLSFDDSNPIGGQSYVGANNSPTPVNVDGLWSAGGKRIAIAPANGSDLSGVLNDQVVAHDGTPTPAYAANMFGNTDNGTLKLYVNGTLVSTLDLTSSTGAIDTTSGSSVSGFSVSAQVSSKFPMGDNFDMYQNRTGTWLVVDDDPNLVQGYNYVHVVREYDTTVITLSRFEFVIDDNIVSTAYGGLVLDNLSMTGSKKISGVDYHTNGAALYDINIDNAYRNTYSASASAVSFSSNTNSYGTVCSAPDEGFPICGGDELQQHSVVNKVVTIKTSGMRLINESMTVTTSVQRTVQGSSSSGSTSILGILLDNCTDGSGVVGTETFDAEVYRLTSNYSYDIFSDITNGAWDGQYSIKDGGAGYNDGMQIIDDKLVYPNYDFRTSNIISGSTFNDGGVGGTARNYLSLSGSRTYYRYFRQLSPTTANFIVNIAGSGGTFVATEISLTGNNIHVEMKGPTQTGWMDCYKDFQTGQWSDGNGARNATAGAGRAFGTNWGLTIGTKNTANTSGYMVIRITVGANFTGEFTGIVWNFS